MSTKLITKQTTRLDFGDEDRLNNRLLLVDFENVPLPDLGDIGANSHVIIFVGASQKNVPISLVVSLQKLGDRVEWQQRP